MQEKSESGVRIPADGVGNRGVFEENAEELVHEAGPEETEDDDNDDVFYAMNEAHAAWECICSTCEPANKDLFSFLTWAVPEKYKDLVTLAEAETSFYRVELRELVDKKMESLRDADVARNCGPANECSNTAI